MIRAWVSRELLAFVEVFRLFERFLACAIILHELDVRLRNEKRDERVCDVQPLHHRDLDQERARRCNLLLAESDVVHLSLLGMREHEPYRYR